MNGKEMRDHLSGISGRTRRELAAELVSQADSLVEMQRSALRSQLAPPEETGGLEQSIRRETGKDDLHLVVRAGGASTTRNGYDRALAFEFGTQKQPARPFFYPAYRRKKRAIYYAIINSIVTIAKSDRRNDRISHFDEM